ncbi:MAG TPA: hypothetical protein PLO37_21195 [Candidatus Hydrogenedentes bacterium]|nr:hypothetical protein [Candidatus Hydrogenedentota bacterium]HPG69371.1 hypothetical protein [Candidatus Hydrogenedentota bacterium]
MGGRWRIERMRWVFTLALLGPGVGYGGEMTDLVVAISSDDIVCDRFIGFGAQWDSAGYVDYAVSDEEFETVARRVRWMRLPMARVMMLTKWCYFGEGRFEWATAGMNALYRQLDVCQQVGTTVFLTDWGAEKEWTTGPGIGGVDDPEYAKVIGTYLDHLLETKGYTCIRYFILTNEPNWEVGDWEKWKRGVRQVAAELAARGLDKRLTFVGSDTSQDGTNESWHRRAVDELADVFGVYDIHRYASGRRVRDGQLEDYWKAQWDYARANDPNGRTKPCMVGEAGLNDDAQHPASSPHIGEYMYGMFMADYAVQAARAGSAAVSAWMLDDNCHPGFAWGMWGNKPQGMPLRPWFYPWALLARYFPGGSVIYRVANQPDDVRILIAHVPGSAGGWSVCVVNRGDAAVAVRVTGLDAAASPFRRYVYAREGAPSDAAGFPEPTDASLPRAAEGVLVPCPADAVAVATSLK